MLAKRVRGRRETHSAGHVRSDIAAKEVVDELLSASVVIWTTTPWTIPQNRAVCFGPDIAYGLYEVSELLDGAKEELGAKIILAEALAEALLRKLKSKAVLRSTVSARRTRGAYPRPPLPGPGGRAR
jgi:isoleucyl-tRNA synthetase